MPLVVELVSPERVAYAGEAKMVICRTVEGDIAFLPGHEPFIGVLATHSVRVLLAGTVQPFHAKCAEPETRGIEIRVLAGEDERGREPTLRQRMRDRRLLDGFRPGPDDQPDIVAIQPSP